MTGRLAKRRWTKSGIGARSGFGISVENGYRVATKIAHFVAFHPNVVKELV